MAKFEVLNDKQYHTYENPDESLKKEIENWINKNKNYNFSIEFMCIINAFCLSKELYKEFLDQCSSADYAEFEMTYEKSFGNFIDPWWDLQRKDG